MLARRRHEAWRSRSEPFPSRWFVVEFVYELAVLPLSLNDRVLTWHVFPLNPSEGRFWAGRSEMAGGVFLLLLFFVCFSSVWVWFILCPYLLGYNLGMQWRGIWCDICLIFSTWRNRVLELRWAGKLLNMKHLSAMISRWVITGWRECDFTVVLFPTGSSSPPEPKLPLLTENEGKRSLSLLLMLMLKMLTKLWIIKLSFFALISFFGILFCFFSLEVLFWRDQTITEHFRACMGTTVCSLCSNWQWLREGLQSIHLKDNASRNLC